MTIFVIEDDDALFDALVMAMNMGADDDMKEPFHTDVLYIKVLAKGYYTEM
ncbi:hypothetical protein HXA35_01465 [Bacillus sp. A301a_S52]|nr:hypothetical protein [Bacillus sp. A301a_S52]